MKKLVFICILGLFFNSVNAQIDSAIFNKLSYAAQQEILVQQQRVAIETQAKSYSTTAGYGKEIGIAVRDGLTAIKDVTLELSKTDVGKVTMYLIVWKVAGKDIIRLSLGIILIFISIILVTKSYFRTFRRRILIKNAGLFKEKEYKILTEDDSFWEYPNAAAVMHVVVMVIMIGISAIIMF
jgi:hypothetical protein